MSNPKNFCFVSEANYPNYINRIKSYNLPRYLELDLSIPFYISTNDISQFTEYENHPLIRVFDINEIRKDNPKSLANELLPDDPTGLYPGRYPWNIRRFILKKAMEDGYTGLFFIEVDTRIWPGLNKEELLRLMTELYEPNTVKTSSARFVYKNRHPTAELFYNHQKYLEDLNLQLSDDELDTLDGTNQLFFGKTTDDLKRFMDNWNSLVDYGYEKPWGYRNGYLSNLSFVIPTSGFKLIHTETPFMTQHFFEDRY